MGKIEEHYTNIKKQIVEELEKLNPDYKEGTKNDTFNYPNAVLEFHSSSDRINETITPTIEATNESQVENGKIICTFPINMFSSLFSSLDIKGLTDAYKDMACKKGITDEEAALCIYMQEKENARDYKLIVKYYLPYKDMLLIEKDDVKTL